MSLSREDRLDLGGRVASAGPKLSTFNKHGREDAEAMLVSIRNKTYFNFVYSSILGDIRLWVGPRLEHLLSS